jgi:hypothetical protein
LKNGVGVKSSLGVVRVTGSNKLLNDLNEKIIGDIGWIALKLISGNDDKGGQDGDE